jgi:integrase
MDKIKELLNLHTDHGQRELRDKAILHQLLFTGCRRQEVIGLNLNHVRQRSDGLIEVLSVTTKGGEPLVRIVPTEPGEVLIKLREMRLSEGATMDGPMYVTYHGKNGTTGRISPKWLWRHFKTWCEQVGIDPEWASPHSTRVTVVTKLLQEGHDYGAVASVTGHKSIEIVRKYDARFRAATDSPALKIKY